jgi:hypothetical protein
MVRIIEVTKEDIAQGHRFFACSCPIARALSRHFPGKHIEVIFRFIRVGEYYYSINDELSEFVMKFDSGLRVYPFSFDLDSLTRIANED